MIDNEQVQERVGRGSEWRFARQSRPPAATCEEISSPCVFRPTLPPVLEPVVEVDYLVLSFHYHLNSLGFFALDLAPSPLSAGKTN